MLSLMIASSAEDCQLCLHSWRNSEEVKLESDVLLDNVRSLLKQMKVRALFSLCPACVSHKSTFQNSACIYLRFYAEMQLAQKRFLL